MITVKKEMIPKSIPEPEGIMRDVFTMAHIQNASAIIPVTTAYAFKCHNVMLDIVMLSMV